MKTVTALRHGTYGRKDPASAEILRTIFEPNDEFEVEDDDVAHMLKQGAVRLTEEKPKRKAPKEKPAAGSQQSDADTGAAFASRLMGVKGISEDAAKRITGNGYNSAKAIKEAQNAEWFKQDGIPKEILSAVKKEFEK